MIEKVLLLSQIFGKEILMDLHVFMSSETENHIFGGWSVCICYQRNTKTNFSRNSRKNLQTKQNRLKVPHFSKKTLLHLLKNDKRLSIFH